MNTGDTIEFHRGEDDEWTAVYLNGKLERVGDSYLADEWLQNYVGVKIVNDNAYLRGGDSRECVAKTLDEVHDYQLWRDRRLEEAHQKREEAAQLLAEAQHLEHTLAQAEKS